MTAPTPLPRVWDLTPFFPAFDGPEYRQFRDQLKRDLDAAIQRAVALAPLDATNGAAWAGVCNAHENLAARVTHLTSYLNCVGAADAANERCKQEEAALAGLAAALTKLGTELLRAFRPATDADWAALGARPELQGAGHTLERLRQQARHQMSPAEERLAADLGVDGIAAWGRLYDTLSGKMSFEMIWPDGRREKTPMAQRRSLLSHADRAVRRAAFDEGNKVWAAHGDVLAAALNGIAGTRHTLYARRGLGHFLDQPYFDNAVSRDTVNAMFTAIAENIELPRGILRRCAAQQGTPRLAWWDLEAPQASMPQTEFSWDECVGLVARAFDNAYPALGRYLAECVRRRWIESEKRPNKRSGAFLTPSPVIAEERVFMTFSGTLRDVTTLAHEIGHGWHSHLLGQLRPCAQDYPMTLAETASTFAENVLLHGLLENPATSAAQRRFLLDEQTRHATTYLLNITARYEFERRFYEERRHGEVSVTRLQELTVETQRLIYGDVLEVGAEDPWFWASKLHFFITGLSFYNFPYAFGFLLSQALFAEWRREGTAFLPRYESFLRATGSATCEEAVRSTLGWDIRDPDFWAGAVRQVEGPVAQLQQLPA